MKFFHLSNSSQYEQADSIWLVINSSHLVTWAQFKLCFVRLDSACWHWVVEVKYEMIIRTCFIEREEVVIKEKRKGEEVKSDHIARWSGTFICSRRGKSKMEWKGTNIVHRWWHCVLCISLKFVTLKSNNTKYCVEMSDTLIIFFLVPSPFSTHNFSKAQPKERFPLFWKRYSLVFFFQNLNNLFFLILSFRSFNFTIYKVRSFQL